jgi:hypothetical protein
MVLQNTTNYTEIKFILLIQFFYVTYMYPGVTF